ncbi:hypothetical protein LCGC14_3113610, partial [marine sediment metagenome]
SAVRSMKIAGARGTFTIDGTKGDIVLVSFEFTGKYIEPTDGAFYKFISNQGHLSPGYTQLLSVGIGGILETVRRRRAGELDADALAFLAAAEQALLGVSEWAGRYAELLSEQAGRCDDTPRRAELAEMARIADLGGAACVEAVGIGVPEHEIALHSTATMIREIAKSWPHAELMDTWTWFQSGLNTDGAHNPVTGRRIERGDILSLNCFPMVAGYYVALERTLFAQEASDAHLRLWQINCAVHDRGKELLVPGNRCADIARELNEIYAEADLLQYRSFGYGHSFGVLGHYYGREAGLELREDCDTVLEPGMVVSMEPMITIPDHMPGAGGYREHDILVIEADG